MPLEAIARRVRLTPDPAMSVELFGFKRFSFKIGDQLPPGVPVPHPDEIYARIVMLRGGFGAEPVVIVALDCLMATETIVSVRNPHSEVPPHVDLLPTLPAGTIARWQEAAGLPPGSLNLSVHATHTHYAPGLQETASLVEHEIAEMAKAHADSWTEVTVHGGVVASSLPVSRLKGNEGNTNIDRSLIVLDFRDPNGQPVARLVNLGVHGLGLGEPGILSPDFIGRAMNLLDDEGGISLFLQGWSGDVAPFNHWGDRSYDKMVAMSQTLAAETKSALAIARRLPADTLRVIRVVKSGVEGEEGFDARFGPAVPGVATRVEFRGIAIGDKVVIVAVSGEVYQDYGPILTKIPREIEGEKPFMPSCGLVNGYSGYIPTKWGFENYAHYEVNTSPFTGSVEEGMIDAFSKLFAALESSRAV